MILNEITKSIVNLYVHSAEFRYFLALSSKSFRNRLLSLCEDIRARAHASVKYKSAERTDHKDLQRIRQQEA